MTELLECLIHVCNGNGDAMTHLSGMPVYGQVDWICKHWPTSQDSSTVDERIGGFASKLTKEAVPHLYVSSARPAGPSRQSEDHL